MASYEFPIQLPYADTYADITKQYQTLLDAGDDTAAIIRHLQAMVELRDKQVRDAEQQLRDAYIDPTTALPVKKRAEYEYQQLIRSNPGRRDNDDALIDTSEHTGMMIDLDHFGQYNKLHGHNHGDNVLRAVGRVMMEATRSSDILFRRGGDEFGIITPHTDERNAAYVAGKILYNVRAIEEVESVPTQMTVSIGVGRLLVGENIAVGLSLADKALLAAKDGRDQFVLASHLPDAQ